MKPGKTMGVTRPRPKPAPRPAPKPAPRPAPKPKCSVQKRYIGCFNDKLIRAIAGAYQIFPPATAVKQCAAKAAKLGHQIMAVQADKFCFTHKSATIKSRKSTWARYGRAKGCKNGRGAGWKNDVYQVKCMKPGKTMGVTRPRPKPAPRPAPKPAPR